MAAGFDVFAGELGNHAERLTLLEPGERAGVVVQWRRYHFPIAWERQFAKAPQELHVEIGYGDGRFLLTRASKQPADAYVGMEISGASLLRARKKVLRSGLANVKLLKVGALFGLKHLFSPASLTSITVNFPDPWPKERHAKHRLMNAGFFRVAAARLKPQGSISLATDDRDYLAYALSHARQSGLFAGQTMPVPQDVLATKYALKWRAEGRPLHYCVFTVAGEAQPVPILNRTEPMPHSLLLGTLPDSPSFDKQVLACGHGHVIVHELAVVLASDKGRRRRWLLRVTVDEPDLKQQLLVSVTERDFDESLIRIEPFGDPVLTETARGAVHAVTEWALALPAGLEIKRRAY